VIKVTPGTRGCRGGRHHAARRQDCAQTYEPLPPLLVAIALYATVFALVVAAALDRTRQIAAEAAA